MLEWDRESLAVAAGVLLVLTLLVWFYQRLTAKAPRRKPVWVSIEGCIGAGKTTLISRIVPYLKKHCKVTVVREPVEEWVESGYLAAANEEPYVVQTYFFHTRVLEFLRSVKLNSGDRDHIILSERSLATDAGVFWKVMCQNNIPTSREQETYPKLHAMWKNMLPFAPSLYVYLKLDPSLSQERMRKRNRDCEQDTVTLKYQEQLAEAHDELFSEESPLEGDVLIVPGELDFKQDDELAQRIAFQILKSAWQK